MQIFFAELSEQSSISLTTSIFTASVTVGLGLLVFVGTQYMTWRLDASKHLRQKLEDLVGEILQIQTAITQVGANQTDNSDVMFRQGRDLSTAKVRIQAVQTVYFPELNKHVSELLEGVTQLALHLLKFHSTATEYWELDGKSESVSEEEGVHMELRRSELMELMSGMGETRSELIHFVMQAGFDLMSYIARDHAHLTRTPRILSFLMGSRPACYCQAPHG